MLKLAGTRAFLRYLWHYKLTGQGRLLAGCGLIAAGVAMGSVDIPAFHLMCAIGGVLAVAFCAGWWMRRPVNVSGRFPEKGVVDEPVTGVFALSNRTNRPAFDLAAGLFWLPEGLRPGEETSSLGALEPGGMGHVSATIVPQRRGIYPLPVVRAFSTFPLGLFRTAVKRAGGTAEPGSILVYPQFHPISAIDVPVSARYQPGGIALSSNVGESMEYIGNREYRPGDPAKQIDHRSWARLAKPVIREFREEYYCRIALVLDTFVPGRRRPGPEGFPEVEAAISLAAAIADVLARSEYIIDIFAAGPELHVFRAGRHTALFEHVLEILACVQPCRKNPFETITPALTEELAGTSSVLCVLLDWDAHHERLVRAAVESGCSVKVFIVREGETTVPYASSEHAGSISQFTPGYVARGGADTL